MAITKDFAHKEHFLNSRMIIAMQYGDEEIRFNEVYSYILKEFTEDYWEIEFKEWWGDSTWEIIDTVQKAFTHSRNGCANFYLYTPRQNHRMMLCANNFSIESDRAAASRPDATTCDMQLLSITYTISGRVYEHDTDKSYVSCVKDTELFTPIFIQKEEECADAEPKE